MEVPSTPRGLIVDLITPLKADGSVDGRGLGKHLDRVLPHVQAILLASPHMGEGRGLSSQQREELLEKAAVVVRGRIPLLVWVTQGTEESTAGTVLLLKKALQRRRYEGPVFWVDTPLYYHSNRGLPSLYRNFSSLDAGPFVLHNDPEFIGGLSRPLKRNNIRTAVLKEVITSGGIAALIFQGTLERAHHYQRASRAWPHFRIYDGDESHFLEHPSLNGVVSVGANLAPRAWQIITRSSLHPTADPKSYPDHLKQIWETGRYLQELKEIYRAMPSHLVKAALSDMGVIDRPGHPPPPKDPENPTERLKELLSRHGDYRECG